MVCPVCEKRKGARFCPAKGETICAVCCGTGREVSIDCPPDCAHLLSAHRYEDEHPRTLPPDTPLLDVNLPSDVIHGRQQLMSELAFTIAKFCTTQRAATDADVLLALQALADTYKTLRTGIYYEKLPDSRVPRELYSALTHLIAEAKEQQSDHDGFSSLNDSNIFSLLVFLYRMGLLRTNGRSRSRRYIEFLRSQFPEAQELKREESRIIVP